MGVALPPEACPELEIAQMESRSDEGFEIARILTHFPPETVFRAFSCFRYFVPSKNIFEVFPTDRNLFLVEWKNYSIAEASWVSRDEIVAHEAELDPHGIYKRYLEEHRFGTETFQTSVNKVIPAIELLPEKILRTFFDETGTEVYALKWDFHGDLFVSEEIDTFFLRPEYAPLLDRFKTTTAECTPLASHPLPVAPLRNTRFPARTVELARAVVEHAVRAEPVVVPACFHLRRALLASLGALIADGYKGPYLIVTDQERLDFWREAIMRFLPAVDVTYITSSFASSAYAETLTAVVYFPETDQVKSPLVVSTSYLTTFRPATEFDILVIDTNPANLFMSTFFVNERTFVIIADEFDETAVNRYARRKHFKRLQVLAPFAAAPLPAIHYIDVYIDLKERHRALYDDVAGRILGETNPSCAFEELKRLIMFPSLSLQHSRLKGCKVGFVLELIALLVEHTSLKVCALGDYDTMLAYVALKTKANYVDWSIDVPRNKLCSAVINAASEDEARRVIAAFPPPPAIPDELTVGQPPSHFVPQPNVRVICVDANCYNAHLDLSCVDIVVNLSNEYTPFIEEQLRSKFNIATVKDVFVFELTALNTIDEVTSSMNEMDTVFTASELIQRYTDALRPNGFAYGISGTPEPVVFADFVRSLARPAGAAELSTSLHYNAEGKLFAFPAGFARNCTLPPPEKKPERRPHKKKAPAARQTNFERICLRRTYRLGIDGLYHVVDPKRPAAAHPPLAEVPEGPEKRPASAWSCAHARYATAPQTLPEEPITEDEDAPAPPPLLDVIRPFAPLASERQLQTSYAIITSAMRRYGRCVRDWKRAKDDLCAFTNAELQTIADALLGAPACPPDLAAAAERFAFVRRVVTQLTGQQALFASPPSPARFWDATCDLCLVMAVYHNGLHVPFLYLNDVVLRSVLQMSGMCLPRADSRADTDEAKCDFLTQRFETLFASLAPAGACTN